MRNTALLSLFLSLAPGVVLAEGHGELTFNRACNRCHSALPSNERGVISGSGDSSSNQRGKGPDLAVLARTRTPAQLRTWIAAPHKVRTDTPCDTRLAAPEEVSDLLDFLYARAKPLPLPDNQRRKAALERALADGAVAPSQAPRRIDLPRRSPRK